MSEQGKNKQKNYEINPLLKPEDLERLKQAGFKTSHTGQPSQPKIKNSSLSGAPAPQNHKPRDKPKPQQFKKPVKKEAEIVEGSYTKPIDPFK